MEHQVHRELVELQAQVVLQVQVVRLEHLVHQELAELQVHLVLQEVQVRQELAV